jgi:hypothetical protein
MNMWMRKLQFLIMEENLKAEEYRQNPIGKIIKKCTLNAKK